MKTVSMERSATGGLWHFLVVRGRGRGPLFGQREKKGGVKENSSNKGGGGGGLGGRKKEGDHRRGKRRILNPKGKGLWGGNPYSGSTEGKGRGGKKKNWGKALNSTKKALKSARRAPEKSKAPFSPFWKKKKMRIVEKTEGETGTQKRNRAPMRVAQRSKKGSLRTEKGPPRISPGLRDPRLIIGLRRGKKGRHFG